MPAWRHNRVGMLLTRNLTNRKAPSAWIVLAQVEGIFASIAFPGNPSACWEARLSRRRVGVCRVLKSYWARGGIVPKAHRTSPFDLTAAECAATRELLLLV
jgi:hypothetical protein